MNILVVSYLFPYPPDGGYKLRVFNTIRELSVRNCVDLLCTEDREISEQYQGGMATYCRAIRIAGKPRLSIVRKIIRYLNAVISAKPLALVSSWDREKIELIRLTAEETSYDVILAEHLLAGHLVLQWKALAKQNAFTAIVNHNVEYDLYKRTYSGRHLLLQPHYQLQALLMHRYEKKINASLDLSIVMSRNDRELFESLNPGRDTLIIPNGVDVEYFSQRCSLPSNHDFYYVANLNYYANVDGVQFFMEQIFPIVRRAVPDCRFFIMGGKPPREIRQYHNGNNVVVTGYVKDVRASARTCRALIVPLRIGSGTRLKIVEAMSMGIPVVSTSKGAEGLDVTHDRDIALADESSAFAERLIKVLTDDRYSSELVAHARRLVEKKYDWKILTDTLAACLADKRRQLKGSPLANAGVDKGGMTQ
jgi:glycosyltransferase involved in cell wall biosynthesis